MFDVIIDAVSDSLIVFPFLFAVYMIMEIIESAENKEKIESALSGKYSPLVASAVGIVPECGFSVMCAKLYDKGLIGIGALISAFISTNDEGLIVLLSSGTKITDVLYIVIWKIVFAVFVGVIIEFCFNRLDNHHVCPVKDECVECGEHHGELFDKFVIHPFYHSARTFFFVLGANIVFGFLIYVVGEDGIFSFLAESSVYQPLITSLFGIVPNCASSIVLARGYTYGLITLPALIGGLSANSGVGLLVLLKNRANLKKNLLIILLLYCLGVILAYLTMI